MGKNIPSIGSTRNVLYLMCMARLAGKVVCLQTERYLQFGGTPITDALCH